MTESQPMTEAMYYVLLSLQRPGHGYGMMQRIRELSRGRVEMGPGTLYGVLTRMKKEGLIVLKSEEDRRKTYAVTGDGRRALLEEYNRLRRMVEDGRVLEEGHEEAICDTPRRLRRGGEREAVRQYGGEGLDPGEAGQLPEPVPQG